MNSKALKQNIADVLRFSSPKLTAGSGRLVDKPVHVAVSGLVGLLELVV